MADSNTAHMTVSEDTDKPLPESSGSNGCLNGGTTEMSAQKSAAELAVC